MSVEIPKCVIAFGSVAPPQGDVIDLKIHLGCTKEVSSFECLLQNWNKKYSPGGTSPINVGMDGSISIGRGTNVPQIITCRVEKVQCESPTSTEHYLRVSGRCWGEKLFRKVVTKIYENQKGEAIVKDLMDSYVGLSHVRDSTELIENTDTTYMRQKCDNMPVFDILKYIAESSDLAGVIGYDFRVAPDGKFEFFAKNSKTSSVSLSEKVEVSEYRKDISRVRNKITSYGAMDRIEPSDGDAWTVDSLDNWIADLGTKLICTTIVKVGTNSFQCNTTTDTFIAQFRRNISIPFFGVGSYQTLNFYIMIYWGPASTKEVRLYAPDSSNYFWTTMTVTTYNTWAFNKFLLGPDQEYDANKNPNGIWQKVGSPSWNNVTSICFKLQSAQADSVFLDGLFFGSGRWRAMEQDSGSQSAYGLRELVEVDEELATDNECDLRAKALLAYLKDPAESLTLTSTVIDYGTTPPLAADKIHVTLPNENVDSDFRIETVEYRVDAKTQTLEITLELGKLPPLLADYLYGMRTMSITIEKLARTKVGRGVLA